MKIPLGFIQGQDALEDPESAVKEISQAIDKIIQQKEMSPPEQIGSFFLEEIEDGGVRISYEDYNTETYGGADVEVIYKLDSKGKAMLEDALSETCSGTLKDMLTQEFGFYLNKKSFYQWLQDRQIPFEHFVWMSDND